MCLMVPWMLLAASTEVVCRPSEHCSMSSELAQPESASILLTKNTRKHMDPSEDGEQEPEVLDEVDDSDDSEQSDTAEIITTSTTTPCAKCQWRATNDCDPNGTIKMDADTKGCNELIGPDSSQPGFCDCNGNGKLDGFEQGFSCGDMADRSIVCGNHCENVCKFEIYGDETCSSLEPQQYFSAVNMTNVSNHSTWSSVRINNPGCTIVLYEDAKAIEKLQNDIFQLQQIPGTEQLVEQKRAELASIQDDPFKAPSFRYEGAGCHKVEWDSGTTASSVLSFEPCIDPLAPVPTSTSTSTTHTLTTTTTTTTCQKCKWQSTNDCSMNGTINEYAARRTCDQMVGPCRDESGFCDCNGNSKFDAFEKGFNCGDLKTEGVVCAEHCEEVCSFRLHSDPFCTSPDPQKYYAEVNVSGIGDHIQWNSVSINQKDCNITLYEGTSFNGSSFEYRGSGCFPINGGNNARSLKTLEPCKDVHPYQTSTSTTTTCLECAWRYTDDCKKDGEVVFQRTCKVPVGKCRHASGFCDCNGNYKLDADEIGFNCGDLQNKSIVCAKHCPNVCQWELFNKPDCSGNVSATFYAATRETIESHEPWQSININLKGCNITLYDEEGFAGEGYGYSDGGCHPVTQGQTARSIITQKECVNNYTTTSTTTPCLKCLWRETSECRANGSILPHAHKKSCKDEVGKCNYVSGFCDCNGNSILDGDETGFDCGDLKYKYIQCKDYCPNVCVFKIHTNEYCNSSNPREYYQDNEVAWVDPHTPWKSVWMNLEGCKMELFQDKYFKGYTDFVIGPGCKDIDSPEVEDARSFQTTQPCIKPALLQRTRPLLR